MVRLREDACDGVRRDQVTAPGRERDRLLELDPLPERAEARVAVERMKQWTSGPPADGLGDIAE